MIEILDLTKQYGDSRAVGPLSFSISAGEIVGLLGLNGAGKTTTLRILACDLLPSSGTVRVDGLDVVEHPHEVRGRIGYLPDTPPVYEDMAVHDYVLFAAQLRGLEGAKAKERTASALTSTGLSDVGDRPIGQLSHGYRQRVGIAQAIVHQPRLLVLDEPISGLDPVQIVEMRELLRRLAKDLTIVLSSHILSEISETCDRILVIRDGLIAAEGTEAELSSRLGRGARTEALIRGDLERAVAIAAGVAGVTSVQTRPATETGEGLSMLSIDAERDVREDLAKALVTADIGLLQLAPSTSDLESVFLSLAAPKEPAPR